MRGFISLAKKIFTQFAIFLSCLLFLQLHHLYLSSNVPAQQLPCSFELSLSPVSPTPKHFHVNICSEGQVPKTILA